MTNSNINPHNGEYGIESIGLSIPSLRLNVSKLSLIRESFSPQYLAGLGCRQQSLCAANESPISLAITAAKRCLDNWNGDVKRIALVIVATESGIDLSRPLSAWVLEGLQLGGALRSYEVKHACFGGTAAVLQARDWLRGRNDGKVALVISTDQALYAPGHSGEPTQGAASCALIIGRPIVASLAAQSYAYSEPFYDFYKPTQSPYPIVNAKLSLQCYIKAVTNCFTQISQQHLIDMLASDSYFAFHTPFPKMVERSFLHLAKLANYTNEQITEVYQRRVAPLLDWSCNIGNSYTASVWVVVARALCLSQTGGKVVMFSYGSGCGAEMCEITCQQNQLEQPWVTALMEDFKRQTELSIEDYQIWRAPFDSKSITTTQPKTHNYQES